jgi:hypothetical protein
MKFEELLLLLLPVAILVGVPTYIFFREKMVKKPKTESGYSKRRVVKLTMINFLLNTAACTYFLTLYILLVSRQPYLSPIILILGALLIFTVNLTFYGNGIYITSIVLEAYTLPQLKKIPFFVTQFVATHLFHGPISHIFIYSGWLLVFFMTAVLDIELEPTSLATFWFLLIPAGMLTGIGYAIAQIYNGSAPYQFLTGLFTLIVTGLLIFAKEISLANLTIGSFFLSLNIAFELSLLFYLFYLERKIGKINWDQSGY